MVSGALVIAGVLPGMAPDHPHAELHLVRSTGQAFVVEDLDVMRPGLARRATMDVQRRHVALEIAPVRSQADRLLGRIQLEVDIGPPGGIALAGNLLSGHGEGEGSSLMAAIVVVRLPFSGRVAGPVPAATVPTTSVSTTSVSTTSVSTTAVSAAAVSQGGGPHHRRQRHQNSSRYHEPPSHRFPLRHSRHGKTVVTEGTKVPRGRSPWSGSGPSSPSW
jgi:hypothetical protein